MSEPAELTEAEEDWITRKISTDEPTLNVAPLLHAVEDIVKAREAAARREALLEAVDRLTRIRRARTSMGFIRTPLDNCAGLLPSQAFHRGVGEAARLLDAALAEPERDEEGR